MLDRRAFMLSLGLSFLAMYLVYQCVSTEDQKMKEQFATFSSVVVASRDILQFESIRPSDVETVRVPAANLPPGRVNDAKDVIDAISAVPISKGEFILDNKIISKNVYSGLDTQISVNRRAMSIPATTVRTNLGYMVRPGNRVDLASFFEYKTASSTISEVKVFMQDLLVLASGRTIQTEPPKGVDQDVLRNVSGKFKDINDQNELREMLNHAKQDGVYQTLTLEVSPQQAQVLAYVLAVFQDTLFVMLRNADDRSLDRKTSTNLFDVMGPDSFLVRGKKAPPQRATPRPRFIDLVGDQQVRVQ